jgi:hypothetical protein
MVVPMVFKYRVSGMGAIRASQVNAKAGRKNASALKYAITFKSLHGRHPLF